MKYIGIPTCPYCKKSVNIVRVWSLKKHGEYMCPRCKGFSNIYLSPLVYLFAVIAIALGFLTYFFAKFITDNLSFMTPVQVILPFIGFFILSLFMVYLEKPVIRRIRKTNDGRFINEQGKEVKKSMGRYVNKKENSYSNAPQVKNDFDYFDNIEQKIDIKEENNMYIDMSQNNRIKETIKYKTPPPTKQTFEEDKEELNLDSFTQKIETEREIKTNKGYEDLFNSYSSKK